MKFEKYQDRKNEYRWRLVARNGRIIADCGEGYKRKRDRDRTLNQIREKAGTARVVDWDPW